MDEKLYGWWLPPDVSVHGAKIDQLISVLHWFMALLFIGWGIFFVYCLIKFRARPGHTALYTPAKAMHIRVVAEQFAWNFQYLGKDGKFGKSDVSLISGDNPLGIDPEDAASRDDIISVNQLHIPVHRPVVVDVSSKDVIHSFNIPVLRVKQDTIPGQQIPIWFEATQPGHFELACAQLCGLGHYRMRADVLIDTPEDFAKWEAENAPPPPEAPAAAAPDEKK